MRRHQFPFESQNTPKFREAYRTLPAFITGIDILTHKTASDLAWLVLLQIDLFDDGEESDIRTRAQRTRCAAYVAKWKGEAK